MKVYIAGKITGDSKYKSKFMMMQYKLESDGHTVMNPAILPEGFPWESYMPICLKMIDACERVVLLPDWKQSKGAKIEKSYAERNGKQIEYVI